MGRGWAEGAGLEPEPTLVGRASLNRSSRLGIPTLRQPHNGRAASAVRSPRRGYRRTSGTDRLPPMRLAAEPRRGYGPPPPDALLRLDAEAWRLSSRIRMLDISALHRPASWTARRACGRGRERDGRGRRAATASVWPATRAAGDCKVLELEGVRNRGDIADAVHDPSAAAPVGPPVARPIVGNDPCPTWAYLRSSWGRPNRDWVCRAGGRLRSRRRRPYAHPTARCPG